MLQTIQRLSFIPVLAVAALLASPAAAQVPAAIAAPGEAVVATFHAEGAQVYDCKADASGKLAWQFREPIATLLRDGSTAGRHYAGPNWEASDGSVVTGKAAANAPGARRHTLAQARRLGAAWQRRAVGRHHGAARQYAWRPREWGLRQGGQLLQRALFGGPRVPAQRLVRPQSVFRSNGSQYALLLLR